MGMTTTKKFTTPIRKPNAGSPHPGNDALAQRTGSRPLRRSRIHAGAKNPKISVNQRPKAVLSNWLSTPTVIRRENVTQINSTARIRAEARGAAVKAEDSCSTKRLVSALPHLQQRWSARLLLLMLVSGLTGCDYYAKPNRPAPEQLEAQLLDGGTLDRSALSGKPWVISIWVPG